MTAGLTIAGLKFQVRLCSLPILVPSSCPIHCHVTEVEVVLGALTCLLLRMVVLLQAGRMLATVQWGEVEASVRPSRQVAVVTPQANHLVCLVGMTTLHGVGPLAIEATHTGINGFPNIQFLEQVKMAFCQ